MVFGSQDCLPNFQRKLKSCFRQLFSDLEKVCYILNKSEDLKDISHDSNLETNKYIFSSTWE